MDWRQLQQALARFIAYAAERDPGAGDLGAWDEEHVEALRAEVKRNAANPSGRPGSCGRSGMTRRWCRGRAPC